MRNIISALFLLSVSVQVGTAQAVATWAMQSPSSVGLDEKVIQAFDRDLAAGKYLLIDSFGLYRCDKEVFQNKYEHDYAKIYGKEAKTRGPLNARLTGP